MNMDRSKNEPPLYRSKTSFFGERSFWQGGWSFSAKDCWEAFDSAVWETPQASVSYLY